MLSEMVGFGCQGTQLQHWLTDTNDTKASFQVHILVKR